MPSIQISCKCFILILFRYLDKGVVDKVEVINKQWVRVKLLPGNFVNGQVSLEVVQFKFNR